MSKQKHQIYEFDNFRLDAGERRLSRDGQPVTLPSKAFDLLLVLVENSGRLVEKEELYQRVWADQVVEESNLTVQMSAIRKALGERTQNPRYVVTVPGHGYRFIGEVGSRDEDREVVIETQTLSHIVIEKQEDGDDNSPPADARRPPDHDSLRIVKALLHVLPRRQTFAGRLWRWTESPGRRAFVALTVVLGGGLALLVYYSLSKQAAPSPQVTPPNQIKSIAVLPFKPLVAESRDESLEMGMADTLIARLSKIRELNVRPISAVRKYAGLEQDELGAGREQKVEAVLDGQIQRSGDRIRVTVRLVRVANGATLWADTFDDKITDIFTVEDSISERVAATLALKLTGEERALVAKHSTNNADAYQLYLKGRYFWNKRRGEAIRRGIDYLNQAVEKDPNYALAHAGLAEAYVLLSNYGESTSQEAYSKARAAATEALRLDDKLSEAHTALAYVKAGYDWDFAGVEREYQRAIELNPNDATARNWHAEYLGLMGHSTESIAEMRRAQELEPLSLIINIELGEMLYLARQYDQAIEELRKAVDLDSSFVRAHIKLGFAYRQKEQYEEAISEFQKALGLDGDTYALSQLGYTYAVVGRRNEAYKVVEQIKERSKRKYVLPVDIALIYVGLGEKSQAFEWLEKAYTERDENLLYLKVDPVWDSLRPDPRFSDLLRRVGLPQ